MTLKTRKQFERLGRYIDTFAPCFNRSKQKVSALRYVAGLFSDASRKNMENMWERIANSGSYQSFHHFITHSPWSSQEVWKHLRSTLPEKHGVLILDDTGIRKRGKHSVGVARQYSGTLGKIDVCQVLVSCVLRTERATWPLGIQLYLPEEWANDEDQRERAEIPENVQFAEKWKIALQIIDDCLSEGFTFDAVVMDGGYGQITNFREELDKRGLYYVVAVKSNTAAFEHPPRMLMPEWKGDKRPYPRRQFAKGSPKQKSLQKIREALPEKEWKKVTWRAGGRGPLSARFAKLRVIPSHKWYYGREYQECWLLLEEVEGEESEFKYYFSNLPDGISLKRIVEITHTRWAVEKNYRDLKQEVGLGHFEGRSYPGFHHHLAMVAIAYTFVEMERQRSSSETPPSIAQVRAVLTEMIGLILIACDKRLRSMAEDVFRNPPNFW